MRSFLAALEREDHETEEQRRVRRRLEGRARRRSLGVREGRHAHVLDAALMIAQVFYGFPSESILRCWIESKCLPSATEAILKAHLEQSGTPTGPTGDADAHSAAIENMELARRGSVAGAAAVQRAEHEAEGGSQSSAAELYADYAPLTYDTLLEWIAAEEGANVLDDVVDNEL